MTIIAYCNVSKLVRVDSKISWNNGRYPEPINKIRHVTWKEHTVTLTQSGPSVISNYLVHKALQAIDDGSSIVTCELPELDCCALFFSYLGKIWFVQAQKNKANSVADVVCCNDIDHDIVSGSGGDFYSAYKAEGLDSLQAIAKTAAFHNGCGFPLRSFDSDGRTTLLSNDDFSDLVARSSALRCF